MNPVMPDIQRHLNDEQAIFEDLLGVVETERDILLSGDHQRLMGTTDRKVKLCHRLAKVQQSRRTLSASLDPQPAEPLGLKGLAVFLDKDQQPGYKAQVRHISGIAQRLDSLNQSNKTFLEEALDTVDQMMSIVTGASDRPAYGRGGTRQKVSTMQLVAKEV